MFPLLIFRWALILDTFYVNQKPFFEEIVSCIFSYIEIYFDFFKNTFFLIWKKYLDNFWFGIL